MEGNDGAYEQFFHFCVSNEGLATHLVLAAYRWRRTERHTGHGALDGPLAPEHFLNRALAVGVAAGRARDRR